MSFDVKISGDLLQVSKLSRHIEIAAARALDDTAGFAQREIIRELDDEFILRGNWYKPKTRFGINVIQTQKGNLTATVFTRADWLLEQEGYNRGIKEPDQGGEHLALPDTENTRHGIKSKVRQSEKARRLLLNAQGGGSLINFSEGRATAGKQFRKAGGVFITKGKYGNPLVYQRVATTKAGDVRRGKRGNPLRSKAERLNTKLVLKYVFRKSVRVERKFIITKTTRNITKVYFGEYLNRNLRKLFLKR